MFRNLKPKPINEASLNPEFLADFGTAAKLIDGEPHIHLQTIDGGPILVKSTQDTSRLDWRGLFMPLGKTTECPDVPEWISEL